MCVGVRTHGTQVNAHRARNLKPLSALYVTSVRRAVDVRLSCVRAPQSDWCRCAFISFCTCCWLGCHWHHHRSTKCLARPCASQSPGSVHIYIRLVRSLQPPPPTNKSINCTGLLLISFRYGGVPRWTCGYDPDTLDIVVHVCRRQCVRVRVRVLVRVHEPRTELRWPTVARRRP